MAGSKRVGATFNKDYVEPILNDLVQSNEWVDTHGFQPSVVDNAKHRLHRRLKGVLQHENIWDNGTNGTRNQIDSHFFLNFY